ncbi:hypothetical protein LJC57_00755 [Parabacteroides sp. OttesenSCG-928-G07]|nr:hypothetical protein [Parabacteroides sp. OttesenSCG-928-G07]
MKRRIFLLLIPLMGFWQSCNEKDICHECHQANTGIMVKYDWSETDESEQNECDLIIIGNDGQPIETHTAHEGTELDLTEGQYVLYAFEDTEMVERDQNRITVHQKENGCLCEPIPFSAGEGILTVEEGKINVGVVKMIRQTRELIVKVRIGRRAAHLMPYESFTGELTGATISRDIFHGFAPQSCTHRELAVPEYGNIDMRYERNEKEESEAHPLVFTSHNCLIGVGGLDIPNHLSLTGPDAKSASHSFFTFDATKPLETFHTLEDVAEAFVIVIDLDLQEDGITGEIRGVIIDWIVGKETDLIANEKD